MSQLEKELELNGLEAPNQLQVNTVTQQMTQQNSEKSKPHSHHCKKPSHYRNQCRQLKREKNPARNNTNGAEKNYKNSAGGQINTISNKKVSNNNNANNKK